MDLELTSALFLLGMALPIAVGLAWYAWQNRSLPGVLPFLWLVPLFTMWSLFEAGELVVPTLTAKIIMSNLQYLGLAFLPVAFLALALDFSGHRRFLTRRNVLLLCIVPVVTQAIMWTNSYHHLFRASEWVKDGSTYEMLGKTWGAWFWVHSGYSYALLLSALVVFVSVARSTPRLYRRPPVAMIVGACIPAIFHILHARVPSVMPAYDVTPIAGTVSLLIFGWGLMGMRLFNLVPIARHALVETLTDGVVVLDRSDRVIDLNESARSLFDKPMPQILAQPLAGIWPAWPDMVESDTGKSNQAEIAIGQNGNRRHCEVRWSPLERNSQLMGKLLVIRDVTDRVLMEDNLRTQALTDALTGLPNRALFMTHLNEAIGHAQRHDGTLFAVVVLDLDRFKLINDSIGHLAGDVLLQSVATKLKRCVRDADMVARMGGDEFMILLNRISTPRDLLPILERIQTELRTPVFFRQQEMTAGSSVGVVIWDPSYEDGEDLLRAADTAMYQAKEAGRGCHRIFDEEMHRSVLRTLKAETDLRAGIRRHDFSMSYQPIADMKTGKILALEALLRWRHPQRGVVFPHEFIPIAENGGLMTELGTIALDEVCSQIHEWQSSRSLAAGLPVSLNISPRQLMEPDFVVTVMNKLAEWRIPSDCLKIELTEKALIRDPLLAKQVMRELRELGIGLCLDDFGSGASSLRHLTTYPVEELKIDTTFISRIAQVSVDLEVVRSLTALAHTLGLNVTAEGVEHSEQWRLLQELGCDHGQGYYVARPMDAIELLHYLDGVKSGVLAGSDRRRSDD